MEELEQLGFKTPNEITNQYGIRIFPGTKGKDDWTIQIPPRIMEVHMNKSYDQLPEWLKKDGMVFYMISERDCLGYARQYTELVKRNGLVKIRD